MKNVIYSQTFFKKVFDICQIQTHENQNIDELCKFRAKSFAFVYLNNKGNKTNIKGVYKVSTEENK